MKFPPWWGSGYFLELHNDKKKREVDNLETGFSKVFGIS